MSYVTPRQQQARSRNWSISRLRALYALCEQLDGDLRLAARAIVDQQLVRKGAEAEGVRRARREQAEQEQELGKGWSRA